ncbi:MAG: hypothetical protein WD200_05300 [Candidatus Andersenbacteria bacterium]
MDINELGMRHKLEDELKRFAKFQAVLGGGKPNADSKEVDIRIYAKYLLANGSITEKRELLANLKSKIIYRDRKLEFGS